MNNAYQLLNEFFDKEKEKLSKQNTEAKVDTQTEQTEKQTETQEKAVEQPKQWTGMNHFWILWQKTEKE